ASGVIFRPFPIGRWSHPDYLAAAVPHGDIGTGEDCLVTTARIALPLALAVASASAALAVAPSAFEAHVLLAAQDDPVALADHAVARSFDAAVAARENDAALAAGDADLARSFLELARERDVLVDPALVEKVALANAGVAT